MSLQDDLKRRSPRDWFERFAKNFRNMGVVMAYARGRGDDVLIVTTTSDGMNLSNVREKGHDFDVRDTSIVEADGEQRIRHVLQYHD